jgi:hypothetical protein
MAETIAKTYSAASRLGEDHPGEAPPVGDAAAVDVVLEVVALLCGEIDRAFLDELYVPLKCT